MLLSVGVIGCRNSLILILVAISRKLCIKSKVERPPDQNNLQAPKPQKLLNERLNFFLTISCPVPND